ncbi:TonB-dependent receptor [Bacteroidota bacterium]
MKFTIVLSIILFLTNSLFSQILLKGVIVDENDQNPISGALIIANPDLKNNNSVITDKNGKFNISKYFKNEAIIISHISYQTKRFVPSSTNIIIKLTPKIFLIDNVVVTGSKTNVARENVPLSVSVINRWEIEESGESAILPIISEKVPGVFVTERGITGFGVANGAAGQISIRGVGGSPNTQVLMLLDGHPQYMGIMGHPLPDAYVASDVERVEIIRGPASILYGSGAMGGVMNIITKKQKEDGISLNGKLTYGSFNTQKYMGSVGLKQSKFNLFTSYNHDYTDGHRDNSSFKIDNGYFKLGYEINSYIKVIADYNIAKFKAYDPGPIGATDSSYITQKHWIDILRGKTSLSVENNYKKLKGAIKIFYNYGEHKIYDGFHSNDINTGLMIYQSAELFRNNTTTIGIDYKTYGGIAENKEAMMGKGIIFGDTTLNEIGIYLVFQQKLFNKLTLNTGIRSENHCVYGNEWIPQVGFSYRKNDKTTFKALVSKGFRSPTIRELYLWAPANEDLEPERLMNYEISLLQRINNKFNFELTCFHIEGSNLIKTIFEGGIPENVNTGEFNNSGIEFLTNYRLNNKIGFHLNYSYLHMKNHIIASPEHQGYFSINYKWNKFSFTVNTQYINGLYTSITNEKEITENYILLNSRVNYKINKHINLYITANNLLNSDYEINYNYPMPGVNFFAGLNFNIKKHK